jgi:hypothetical protein
MMYVMGAGGGGKQEDATFLSTGRFHVIAPSALASAPTADTYTCIVNVAEGDSDFEGSFCFLNPLPAPPGWDRW